MAGALAGLGLAIAAAAPFTGVPPQGVSGKLAAAQIEVRVIAAGEFTLDPIGTVLPPTPFPPPGERGGPSMAVTVRNITGLPVRISVRLLGIAPELDNVVNVRGSVAGAVVLHGSLADANAWSEPAGLLASGATSTLRIRFKLRPGVDRDEFAGRLDIRQLEVQGTRIGEKLDAPSDVQKVVPGTEGTTPVRTPAASAPQSASPAPATTPSATPNGGGSGQTTATPQPPSSIPPRGDDTPKRRAPDEGSE